MSPIESCIGRSARYALAAIMALSLTLCSAAQAQQDAGAPAAGPGVYPYVLSVAHGTKIRSTSKFPALHYKRIAGKKGPSVIVRAAWQSDNVRNEFNAGTEPISLTAQSGTIKAEKWSDALDILLSTFDVQGHGTLSLALFDYEKVHGSKQDADVEAARLSPWLNIPTKLK